MMGLLLILAACRNPIPSADPVWEGLVSWTEQQRVAWQVPGIALAVVRDGWATETAGLGVQRVGQGAPVTADTVFRVGSLSKVITGVLALQEIEAGRLRADDPLDQRLPDLALAAPHTLADLTLEGVLSHSAGLQSTGLPNTCSADADGLGLVLAERMPDWNLWVAPDTLFQYSSPGFALGGHVVERSARQAFADLAQERVFDPAGLVDATYDVDIASAGAWATGHSIASLTGEVAVYRDFGERSCGASFPSGGLMASADDLARVAEVLLDGGEPWLGPDAFEDLTTAGWALSSTTSSGWGLLQMTYRDHQVWLHTGSLKGYQAMLAVLPDVGAGVVVLVNSDHAVTEPPEPWSKPTQRIALEAFDRLLDLPAQDGTSSVRPVEDWDRYVGHYASDYELGELMVTLDHETLWLTRRSDDEPVTLTPYSADSFLTPYTDSDGLTYWSRFTFEADDSGAIAWITSQEGIAVRVE